MKVFFPAEKSALKFERKENNMKNKNFVYNMVVIAMFAAVLGVIAPFSINIGPIPISFATMIVMIAAFALGAGKATASVGIYLLLGLVGVPVFSNWGAGAGKLFGPTGGYLIGYLFLSAIVGAFAYLGKKCKMNSKDATRGTVLFYVLSVVGMLLGNAVLYFFGTAWYLLISEGKTLEIALTYCVIPFLPGDAIKCVVAVIVGPILAKTVDRFKR